MFYVENELKLKKKKKQNPVDLSIVWVKKNSLQAAWVTDDCLESLK